MKIIQPYTCKGNKKLSVLIDSSRKEQKHTEGTVRKKKNPWLFYRWFKKNVTEKNKPDPILDLFL